jgi:hypothetical protein
MYQPPRKGTGFTNLSRVMGASKNNKLASTVAGGVTNQVQGLQSGIQESQEKFGQEAEKGRLDTDAAKAQRANVVGRFDEANYKPDESKFAVSTGLQDQYGQKKTALQSQQAAAKATADTQRASVQARYDADVKALAASKAIKESDAMRQAKQMNREKTLGQSISSLKGLLGSFSATAAGQESERAAQLAGLDTQFGEQTAAEKATYMKSERDRLMAANMPTEAESAAFQRFQTGTYSGPKELGDAQTLLGRAQQTQQLGDLSRSSGGRQELLRQFVGGRDYTQGQRGLDEAILGQDTSGGLTRAAKETRGSERDVQMANRMAGAKAQDLTGKAAAFGAETRGQLDAAGVPISADIDTQFAAAQAAETGRQATLKGFQDVLTSTDPKYAGLDKLSRAGLALQDAANQGFLKQSDIEQLMGTDTNVGLIERGLASGVDINKMLAEKLTGTSAQNLTRAGAASDVNVARLNALSRLQGKTGSDLEFKDDRAKLQAGGIGLDTTTMQQQIAAAEAEKARVDPTYKYTPYKYTPTEQMLIGSSQNMKDLSDSGEMTDALTGLSGDLWNKNDHTARIAEGTVQKASGAIGAGIDTQDAILKKILSSGLVGKYGDKYGGKQLNQLVDYQTKIKEELLGSLTKEGMNMADGLRDLTQTGRMDQALAKLSGFDAVKNITGNVTREVSKGLSTALSGGKTGDWATSEYNTKDATTGKKVAIGSYANKSSDAIMKQMLSTGQLGRTGSSGKGGAEGAKALNELNKYYKAALKREGKKYSDEDLKENIDYDPKDVESFLNRLKPAAYDYKKEVKDSPLASKDRQLGVMAQDLEKSKLGKEAVMDTPKGKIVDYKDLEPKMLASLASLNQRLKKIEGKGDE